MKKIVSLLLTLMLAVGLLTGCTAPKELYDNEDAIAGGSSAFEALNWAESSLTDDGTIDYTAGAVWLVLNWRFPLPSMQSQLMSMYMTLLAAVSEAAKFYL